MSKRLQAWAAASVLSIGLVSGLQAVTLSEGQSVTVTPDGRATGHGVSVSNGRSFSLDGGERPLRISIRPGEGLSIAPAPEGTGLKIGTDDTFLIYPDGQVVENDVPLKENPNVTIDREGEIQDLVLAPGQNLSLARDGLVVVSR